MLYIQMSYSTKINIQAEVPHFLDYQWQTLYHMKEEKLHVKYMYLYICL